MFMSPDASWLDLLILMLIAFLSPDSCKSRVSLSREVCWVSGKDIGARAALFPFPPGQQKDPSAVFLFIMEEVGRVDP